MNHLKAYKSFNGNRLKQARCIRNITLQELSEHLDKSHQAISKYENGKATPSPEDIIKLSKILSFEPSFFYLDNTDTSFYEKPFIFRSKASAAKKYKDQTKELILLVQHLVSNIELRVALPKFDLDLMNESKDKFSPTSDYDIEVLATKVRRNFNLGDGPISNLTALCEKMGVIITYINLNHQGIDACSVLLNERPYIILNGSIESAARMRFNIAHELGHILLHSRYLNKVINRKTHSKRMEYEANRFAGALLMPERGIVQDISALGLDYLITLKQHWKVSLQAIIYRAEQLELFTPEYALYLRQQISRKKWRTKEPLDDEIPLEQPKLLSHAIKYLEKAKSFFLSQLSFATGLTIEEIQGFCDGIQQLEKKETSKPVLKAVNIPR